MPPDKQEQVWSQLRGYERDGSIVITVTDTGAGMSEDELIHTFGEGVQFNAGKLQAGGGSGLGLFITKGLVEQHGGRIWASSEGQGRGSTFAVELPAYAPPAFGHTVGAALATDYLPNDRLAAIDVTTIAESLSSPEQVHYDRSDSKGTSNSTLGHQSGAPESRIVGHIDTTVAPWDSMSSKSTTVSMVGSSKCPIDSTPLSNMSSRDSSTKTCTDGLSMYATKFPNILIVDDAISNRKLLHRLLSAKGFTCHQAVDGLDALRVYEEVTRQHHHCHHHHHHRPRQQWSH